MKKFILVLGLGIILYSCETATCTDNGKFTYNSSTGKCQKCNGEEGLNSVDYNEIRSTRNAECTDLSNITLVYLLDTAAIDNFQEFGYNILQDYNFSGCKFDSSALFFNHIYGANFEGADLRYLQYGYAYVTGKTDSFTQLPLGGGCTTSADSCNCMQ